MNLRNRLTLISSLIFGVIFAIASLIIYATFYTATQNSLIKELQKTTLIAAIYYLEKDEQPTHQHREVKSQFEELIQSSMVAVINARDEVEFGDLHADRNINKQHLEKVRRLGKLYFKSNNHFYYGIHYLDNQGDFVVFIKESNALFQKQMDRLLSILIIVLLIGWISIILLSKGLSKIAYKPLKRIIKEVQSKDISKLQEPISVAQTKDELQELIETYNLLLSRIGETFNIQKNFVNYVSHEFKTPLTAIAGNLEVFSQKPRSTEEYQEVTRLALENVYQLEEILNNMLLLSGAIQAPTEKSKVRIDEVLWNVIEQCQQNLQADIQVHFPEIDPDLFRMEASENTIHLAIYNLLENAIKYSDNKPVEVEFIAQHGHLELLIRDHGIGIPESELPFITDTFYRGKNAHKYKGSGIGLSLTSAIFKQYGILFKIHSSAAGTEVLLIFPSQN